MKYAIFGDIHGNFDALEACLEHMKSEGVERHVCLGDIVGYGAQPGACVEAVRGLTNTVIAGNHEYAVMGRINLDFFNAYAREAIEWTRGRLSKEEKDYLGELPLVERLDEFTVTHSTLHAPEAFGYIESLYSAHLSISLLDDQTCFVGHSHIPVIFVLDRAEKTITYTMVNELLLAGCQKALVNVGSVGQPRDENPHAAYATYVPSEGYVKIHRVPYDVERAAKKIREAGLPEILSSRLMLGR